LNDIAPASVADIQDYSNLKSFKTIRTPAKLTMKYFIALDKENAASNFAEAARSPVHENHLNAASQQDRLTICEQK